MQEEGRPSIVMGVLLLVVIWAAFLVVSDILKEVPVEKKGQAQEGRQVSEVISGITFENYAREPVRLSRFLGKILVVSSWATWCAPCAEALVEFSAVQQELPADKAVIIAINRGQSFERAKRFSDDLGVTGRIQLLLDREDAFYTALGGFTMPETVFLAPDGTLLAHKRGPISPGEIQQTIEELLYDKR